ncbi:ribonuclease H-like domain-containing protein [Tanacetum coccineum]
MNGHTADRCLELVGYPPNFKKRNGFNQGSSSNAATPDVSNLNMTASHPNGTKATVTHIGSLKLTNKITINDVLLVRDYQDFVLRTQVGTGSESNGLYYLNTCKRQIVHLDVWGPYNVQSREGFKYFSTVVDDFTRAVWVFSLRGKDEGRLPLNIWDESVLIDVYLINRIPSSVLSGKSPYELIYKVEPNLSHLKTFRCLCFSTMLNNSDKFSSRSENSVFVGYSFDKKGYKLFSLESQKVFYSRDVKLLTHIWSFKLTDKNV